MSDYESQSGKIKLASIENETSDDTCKRIWLEKGHKEEDYTKSNFFDEYYEKYIRVKEKIWEILEVEDHGDDDDMFCRLHDNKDGTFSFHTRYYNGGTCMTEMLQDELENLK